MPGSTLHFTVDNQEVQVPLTRAHTLVLGSGAAGLNAAAQLYLNGVRDVLILTEGLSMGTSINTGSDKQTYYKLSLYGSEADSPQAMAETYFANGSMHGDLALVESSLSVRSFMTLVNLGVPFPRDAFGQFVGYKTDHDPRQRATSCGPYTSREMCLRLIEQVKGLGIEVREGRCAVELVTFQGDSLRVVGLVAVDPSGKVEAYACENLVFAVGGPGGLYKTSVYPEVQTGAIGLGLMAGACAANLSESQFGLASTKFRWNVSGSYMQVIPRVVSRAADGISDEREFLAPFFGTPAEMNGMIFLKGYQWPFDARKTIGGSSITDILVTIETLMKGRRVFLDFRSNPGGFSFAGLPEEARSYLEKSGATQATPFDRLAHMNPDAVELYREHAIDLAKEALEVAVCAQHNNGGLAGNIWYESTNLKHFFPIGEVNGSHGVTRPGGSALNAGQVGGFRAAEYIAHRYNGWTLSEEVFQQAISESTQKVLAWAALCTQAKIPWQIELEQLRERMTRSGSQIRSLTGLSQDAASAREQTRRISQVGCGIINPEDIKEAFQVRQLAFAQAAYLAAIQFNLESGVGSRGSAIVLDPGGKQLNEMLDGNWKMAEENPSFRDLVLETVWLPAAEIQNRWIRRRAIPESDAWFETAWARFRDGAIYSE